jgi:hypothetical protein
LEHLVGVNEGSHSNVTKVGQHNFWDKLSLPIFYHVEIEPSFKVWSIYTSK